MADGSGQMQMGFGFLGAAVEAAPAGETPMTREQRRSRRKRPVRARTISVKRMTKRELEAGRLMYPAEDHGRPRARAECPPPDPDGKRRCRFVSCAWHTYLSVNPKDGAIKLHFPDIEDPGEIPEPCGLDACERGGLTLEEVGTVFNVTRERVRQMEVKAIGKLLESGDPAAVLLVEMAAEDGHPGARGVKAHRRLPVLQPGRDDGPGPVDDLDDEHTDDAGRPLFPGHPLGYRAVPRVPDQRNVSEFAGPSPAAPQTPYDRRERALMRTAARLGRATARLLCKLAGLAETDEWAVESLASRGLLRRDGDAYAATDELARLIQNNYQCAQAAE